MSWDESSKASGPDFHLEVFDKKSFHFLYEEISDPELLFQWAATTFEFPIQEDVLGNFIASSNCFPFLLKMEGEIIAYGDLFHEPGKEVRLCRILVGKKYRGSGYGKILVNLLVREAIQQFPNLPVRLFVFEENHQARRCYEACGFRFTNLHFDLLHRNVKINTLQMQYYGH